MAGNIFYYYFFTSTPDAFEIEKKKNDFHIVCGVGFTVEDASIKCPSKSVLVLRPKRVHFRVHVCGFEAWIGPDPWFSNLRVRSTVDKQDLSWKIDWLIADDWVIDRVPLTSYTKNSIFFFSNSIFDPITRKRDCHHKFSASIGNLYRFITSAFEIPATVCLTLPIFVRSKRIINGVVNSTGMANEQYFI